jgi:hypothetical protein
VEDNIKMDMFQLFLIKSSSLLVSEIFSKVGPLIFRFSSL